MAAELAGRALAASIDPDARALSRAAAGLALGVWPAAIDEIALRDPRTGGDPIEAALNDAEPVSISMRVPLHALLAEAALANARVDIAAKFLERYGSPPDVLLGGPHPFLTFVRALAARVATFQADITRAEGLVDDAIRGATSPVEALLALACSALVRGNADQRRATRLLVDRISVAPAPVDAITRGCFVLAAYGAVALGDAVLGAQLILIAGGDADLSQLRIIDRALGLEVLAAVAVAENDADSAEAWLARLAPLSHHPIAAPTVDRVRSRISLLAGDAGAALASAEKALFHAKRDGRAIEVAEAEILRARAQIAQHRGGAATRDLASLVSASGMRGHFAVRRSAARELRQAGRRLPPAVSSGWEGLSGREREVALLVAKGRSNTGLAQDLFLSEHTVRMHVSRVLQAFGVATRTGVAVALSPAGGRAVSAALTSRQLEVVTRITAGATNRQIAADMGIGVTTVEKHVNAILRRWDVRSRAEIAHLASNSDAQ
ncbi:MAG: helix-turn-helix transcriptional regulator [Nakamurella sp.]